MCNRLQVVLGRKWFKQGQYKILSVILKESNEIPALRVAINPKSEQESQVCFIFSVSFIPFSVITLLHWNPFQLTMPAENTMLTEQNVQWTNYSILKYLYFT